MPWFGLLWSLVRDGAYLRQSFLIRYEDFNVKPLIMICTSNGEAGRCPVVGRIVFIRLEDGRCPEFSNGLLVICVVLNFFHSGYHSRPRALPICSQGGVSGRPESSSRAAQQPLRQTLLSISGYAHGLFFQGQFTEQAEQQPGGK